MEIFNKMTIKTPRPKRCSICNKIIRQDNKSGYCQYHGQLIIKKNKKLKICHICDEPCSGKLRMEIRKGVVVSFCTYHFNRLNLILDMKELRLEIKRLKSL